MKHFILLFLSLYFTTANLFAEPKKTELNQVKTQIKDLTNNLSRLKKRKNHASSKLKQVEQEYGSLSKNINELNKQVSSKKQRINTIKQDISLQKKWLKQHKTELAGQMRAAHALGNQEQLKLFFNQQDPLRSSRMLQYYQYFSKARVAELKRINNSLQLLRSLELEKQKEILVVANLVSHKQTKQNELSRTKKTRQQLLGRIKKDERRNRAKLSRLKKEAKELKQFLVNLDKSIKRAAAKKAAEKKAAAKQATNKKANPKKSKKSVALSSDPSKYYSGKTFRQLKGKMQWPVKGKVLKKFGNKRIDSLWNGLLIGAKEGTKLHSVAHGQVVFADWFKGFGLLIIVKHDKNYMSLYAYNQSLYVKVGDWVKAGGLLATVGKSGGRDKAGLYFEIRKRNKAINPIWWLKR